MIRGLVRWLARREVAAAYEQGYDAGMLYFAREAQRITGQIDVMCSIVQSGRRL